MGDAVNDVLGLGSHQLAYNGGYALVTGFVGMIAAYTAAKEG